MPREEKDEAGGDDVLLAAGICVAIVSRFRVRRTAEFHLEAHQHIRKQARQ